MMKSFASKICLILGIQFVLFAGFLYWQRITPQRLAFTSVEASASVSSAIKPTRITIPSLAIDLPIFPAENTSGWQVHKNGVSYLSSSVVPGEKGNSILYGHNWPNLLGDLPKITPDSTIEITYSDGTKNVFVVSATQEVSPKDTSVLAKTDDQRVTLYTCTGFLDSKRFVAVAMLK